MTFLLIFLKNPENPEIFEKRPPLFAITVTYVTLGGFWGGGGGRKSQKPPKKPLLMSPPFFPGLPLGIPPKHQKTQKNPKKCPFSSLSKAD